MTEPSKVKSRTYKTIESETIIFYSTIYAVISLLLVGIVFRFWLPLFPATFQVTIITAYALASVWFLYYIYIKSTRRTKINKLPPTDITSLCYLVKAYSQEESKTWHTTLESFNSNAMKLLFDDHIPQIIPPHDYFSYMLAERYIEIASINNISNNTLSIQLSSKAILHLDIFEKAEHW